MKSSIIVAIVVSLIASNGFAVEQDPIRSLKHEDGGACYCECRTDFGNPEDDEVIRDFFTGAGTFKIPHDKSYCEKHASENPTDLPCFGVDSKGNRRVGKLAFCKWVLG